jgi:hypothetical protein
MFRKQEDIEKMVNDLSGEYGSYKEIKPELIKARRKYKIMLPVGDALSFKSETGLPALFGYLVDNGHIQTKYDLENKFDGFVVRYSN